MTTTIEQPSNISYWLQVIQEQLQQWDTNGTDDNARASKRRRLEFWSAESADPETPQQILDTLKALDSSEAPSPLDRSTAWHLAVHAASKDKAISGLACRILRTRHSVTLCKNREGEEFYISPVLLAIKTKLFLPEMLESLMQKSERACPIGVSERGMLQLQKLWEGTPLEELIAGDPEGMVLQELYQAADYCNCTDDIPGESLVQAINRVYASKKYVDFGEQEAVVTCNLASTEEVVKVQLLCRLLAICEIKVVCKVIARKAAFEENLAALLSSVADGLVSSVWMYAGHKALEALARVLEQNQPLQLLDLSREGIRDHGVAILSEALKHNTTLRQLNLYKNGITSHGAKALAEMLKHNRSLEKLNLAKNRIKDDGVTALFSALQVNQTLRKLNLFWNSIKGTDAFCAQGLAKNTALKALTLNGNRTEDKVAISIAKALKCNYGLQKLKLRYNYIRSRGGAALAEALKQNQALEKLDLSGNWIGWGGGVPIARALKQNHTLRQLNLHGNSLGLPDARAFAAALKTNTALEQLDLSHNSSIGDQGAIALANALQQQNNTLTWLKINYSLGVQGAEAMRALQQVRPQLKIECALMRGADPRHT